MLKNYLKTALRNLLRHKGYALINTAGLAVGLACCILIMLFVRHEWSYDRFHAKADQIYRAWVLEDYGAGEQFFNTVTPIPLGPALAANFPEVEATVRTDPFTDLVRRGAATFSERVYLADPAFFDVFDFPLRRGDPATALSRPNALVLTEGAAARYFGQEDPLGQTLSIRVGDAFKDFVVTGLAADPPSNSSIRFALLIPHAWSEVLYNERMRSSWTNVFGETYVLLREDVRAAAFEAKLPTLVRQIMGDRYREGIYMLGLQPLTGIHLGTHYPVGLAPISDPAYSYILSALALFILLIACINFMTLSVSRSAGRAREVGVRKVVGAHRRQLMAQFWGEAFVVTGLALVLGLVLAEVLRPLFNTLAEQNLVLSFDAPTLLLLLGLLCLVGLVAGSYPALLLSGFQPMDVLAGRLQLAGDLSLFRRGLIVVQFGLSIFLLASTLGMARQLHHLQTKNLGFDKEQVVVLRTNGALTPGQGLRALLEQGRALAQRMEDALAGNPAVVSVTTAGHTFGEGWTNIGYDADDGTYREFTFNAVEPDFLETLGVQLAAGRTFSRDVTADARQAIIVNEALVAAYGWAHPIGQHLPGPFEDHEVVGVVKDFNFASLHTPVTPLVLAVNPAFIFQGASNVNYPSSPVPKILVRVRPGDLPGTMALLEQTWKKVAPDQPFDYAFLDEAVESQYRQEARLSRIVGIASLLSIVIACLGLFGLAALAALRRTKEVGVRKVLGASVPDIVVLLSKDFAGLVLLAFALAAPVAYLALRWWLADFAYPITVGPGLLLLAGGGALAVALLTVGFQALRTASANPVKALRYE